MNEPYAFPGLAPYVEAAADAAKIDDPALRARVGAGPHADAAASALSQVADAARRRDRGLLGPDAVEGQFARVRNAIRALDAQREAIKAALADAEKAIKAGDHAVPEPVPRRVVERRDVAPKPSLPIAPPFRRPASNASDAGAKLPPAEKPEKRSRSAPGRDKPAPPPPTDETGRILDDIDGDVEPVIHPGVGEPTGPPAKDQPADEPKADDGGPKPSDKPKAK